MKTLKSIDIKHALRLNFYFTLIVSVLMSLSLAILPRSANALSGSDFNAARIMDDAIFYNKSTMNIPDIQNFLNSKVPVCDTWGTQSYGGTTRAAYAASNGISTPFTCLKDYSQSVPTVINGGSDLCTGSIASGTKSAANIIYDVAHACGVNPQVLIVLLQKEQSLVTDDWPWPIQYRSATGYGCPDTAPCDSEYYGFFNQVYQAAKAFKRYQANPQNYNYSAGRNNTILWHPNAGCGSSTVFIQNQATAGLYTYTPYRPNQAALNNLYGLGDSCSSYGNRNFWRMHNDWFGPTLGSPFISNGGKVYILGTDNTYYYVPSQELLSGYGFGTSFNGITPVSSSFLSDRTYKGNLPWIARFQDNDIHLVEGTRRHHFTSPEIFVSYGYSFGDEAVLPSYMKNALSSSSSMQSVMKVYNRPDIYSIESGKRKHIGNETAFYTLGSPVYSSRASVTVPWNYALSIYEGAPILPSNTKVREYDTGEYGAYSEGVLYPTTLNTLKSWDLPGVTYVGPSISINQLTQGSDLGVYVKSSGGTQYLLDRTRKFTVDSGQLTNLGLSSGDFITVPDSLLAKFNNGGAFVGLIQQRGSLAVYSVINGERYHIYGEDDFITLGYSWSNIDNIEPETMALFTNSGKKLYRNGKLLRPNNSSKVYVVDGSFKRRHIPSEGIFLQYGYGYGQVNVVPPSHLNGYDEIDPLSQVVKDSSSNLWLIDRNKRYSITNDLATNTYGYNTSTIIQIQDSTISSYQVAGALSDLVRASNSPKVYKIESGQKRWITSEQALFDNGYNFSQVKVYSSTFVSSIPTGSNIN